MSEQIPEDTARVRRVLHIVGSNADLPALLSAAGNGEEIIVSEDVSEETNPVILIADGGDEEQIRHVARRLRVVGINTHLLAALALAAVANSQSRVAELVSSIRDIRLLSSSPLTVSLRQEADYIGTRHFQTGNIPHYRAQQAQLAGQYNTAAKWQGGAFQSAHRSRENRHAERQRNWAALQK